MKIPLSPTLLQFESIFQSNQNFWSLSPQELIKYDLEKRFIVIINSTIKIKKLRIGGGYIQYSDNKYIDIHNIEMQLTRNTQINSPGVKLRRQNQTLEIYGDIDDWVEYLKPFSIQFYFQQRYSIQKKIEKGTLQNWFTVKCKSTSIEYSVHIIEKNNDLNRRLLIHNLQLLRNLKLHNLIKMKEIFESRNLIYIVCENIEGTFIDDLRLDKQLTEFDISTIMRILFTILEYLHLNNVVLGHRAVVSNLYLKNPKDWSSVYFIDHFDLLSQYQNNNDFYSKAQLDVNSFGNIMKYLLDYNNDAAKLYSYDLQEWSKQAFDFYQKINDTTKNYSSYDALQHPFIFQSSKQIVGSFNSRKLFHMSQLGIQSLEISTELNSNNQSSSNSPIKKGKKLIKIKPAVSTPTSPIQKATFEDSSSQGSIDMLKNQTLLLNRKLNKVL
ncbi:unnamed protein product (macronuclear) [Paramecium tetraurelia]|uniref:Protein kinase domain-containing protein n=1 Tax=Paramecium tetraurelia TaxID=5888 RepID=A0DFW8_PARTE|nr:uncharacterized protein GSPATT00002063001 [Paramecium tetraurelia]CAK81935.1 unnamed protein product [Paramecium tetraurelia]|eukprot:XP_001449332.1 hypothetical protein (macronuclear) [Paramecium tetraurelia strain d4-2]